MKKRLLLALWLSAAGSPFLLSSPYRHNLFQHNSFARVWEINLALCAVPYILLFDAALIALIIGAAKGMCLQLHKKGHALSALFVGSSASILCASYLTFIAIGWLIFPASRSFPSAPRTIELLSTLDIVNIMRVTTPRDLATAACALLACAAVVGAFWWAVPAISNRRKVRPAIRHAVVCALCIMAVGVATRLIAPGERLETIRPVLAANIAPQIALFWQGPMYGFATAETFDESLVLEAAYEPRAYASKAADFDRKNVVLVMVEALRQDVVHARHQGQEVTPALNRLAREGRYFGRAYAQSSETSASQTAILLGQYPLRFPSRDLYADTSYPHAAIYDLFSQLGYWTAYLTFEWSVSKRLTASDTLDLLLDPQFELTAELRSHLPPEFRSVTDPGFIPTAYLDRAALEVLKSRLAPVAGGGRPFFVAWYLYSSHFPYNFVAGMGPAVFLPLDLGERPSFFNYPPALAPVLKNRYYQALRYTDGLIEDLLSHLSALGVLEQTIVVITGDHGELFHEHGAVTHGGPLHEQAIRVPLIVSGPGAGDLLARDNSPVSHVDIAPTILGLLGLPPYGGHQGRRLLQSERESGQQPQLPTIYSSVQSVVYEDAVIEWPWKLVKNYSGKPPRLFNLESDPGEEHDQAAAQPHKVAELGARIVQFRRRQFSYYQGDRLRRNSHFPPRHNGTGE